MTDVQSMSATKNKAWTPPTDAEAEAYIDEQLASKGMVRVARSERGRFVRVYPILGWTTISIWAAPAKGK